MKKVSTLSLFLFIFGNFVNGQKHLFQNELSFSVPVIWSKYEVTNVIGPKRKIVGNSWNTGFNVSYNRNIYKGLFVTGGAGYYKQNFNIHRPFDYNDPSTRLLYTTKDYSYNCMQLIIGLGYQYVLQKKFRIKGTMTYNQFTTFKQHYEAETVTPPQDESDKYLFSKSFNLSIGATKFIYKSFSFGTDIIVPVITKWRKDAIFREKQDEYFKSKASIGISFSINYNF